MRFAFSFLIISCLLLALSLRCSMGGAEEGPVQPIEFSHRVHAGENSIPCLYCHAHAQRSTVAGIPSVERCMGCHKITANDKPEVQKLATYWQEEKPVEWVRVYDLPDFVYFSHKRHVLAQIDCSNCHGRVAEMDRIYEVVTQDMGWCMNCHRAKEASLDCVTCHK